MWRGFDTDEAGGLGGSPPPPGPPRHRALAAHDEARPEATELDVSSVLKAARGGLVPGLAVPARTQVKTDLPASLVLFGKYGKVIWQAP